MKHISMIIGLTILMGLAACGSNSDQVTRAEQSPLAFQPEHLDAPDYQSSRAAIDLLSLT